MTTLRFLAASVISLMHVSTAKITVQAGYFPDAVPVTLYNRDPQEDASKYDLNGLIKSRYSEGFQIGGLTDSVSVESMDIIDRTWQDGDKKTFTGHFGVTKGTIFQDRTPPTKFMRVKNDRTHIQFMGMSNSKWDIKTPKGTWTLRFERGTWAKDKPWKKASRIGGQTSVQFDGLASLAKYLNENPKGIWDAVKWIDSVGYVPCSAAMSDTCPQPWTFVVKPIVAKPEPKADPKTPNARAYDGDYVDDDDDDDADALFADDRVVSGAYFSGYAHHVQGYADWYYLLSVVSLVTVLPLLICSVLWCCGFGGFFLGRYISLQQQEHGKMLGNEEEITV